jgi:PEGA domain
MLRTHETAPHIQATTPVEDDPEEALKLFRPEASPDAAAGPSGPARSDPLERGFDSATVGFGPSSNRPTQRKPRPTSVTEGPRFTFSSNELADWEPSSDPADRDLMSPRRALRSPARSRPFVWVLLSAPVAVFLVSWLAAGTESTRRTAIEASGRVRSAIASMIDETSFARQSGRPSAAEPPLAADRREPIPAPPPTSTNNNSSPEPTVEQPARPSPSDQGAAPSPAPALSKAQASSPATNGLLAGTLSIDSRPVGASVFIDGQLVGTTPLLLPYISPGTHAVRLHLAAHQDWRSTTQVVPDGRNRVTAALEEDQNAPEP